MASAKEHRFLFDSGRMLARILLVFLAMASVCGAQQNPPLLQITTPAGGTVVNPGQTISVTVTSPANVAFAQVGVVGEDPIGFSSIVTSLPAQFSMAIPTDIACRTFMLTAVGATSSGQSAQSATILIDVERPDLPAALSAQLPRITLKALGEQFPIVLFAFFSDGSILDVTQSSNVVYSSSNTGVATVNTTGMVTGLAAGRAAITATYSQGGQSVQAVIPVTVPPPMMTVTPVSSSFGNQNVGTSSASQELTVTNTGNVALKIISVGATGDFSETDNCPSSSPLPVSGTCTINVTFAPTGIGSRQGTVSIANGFNILAASVSLSGTGIGQPTTATSVASSASPSVFGQSVTLTATVRPSSGSGTPTGTVTFNDGPTVLGTESLANGQATFTTSSFSVGSHSITASYSGDSTFLASVGTLTQTVNAASTTTTVSSSANPSLLNGSVTFTGTVSVVTPGAGVPTGTIAFKNGSTVLATVQVTATGQATFSTPSLAAGSNSITATYSGDANFNGSLSASLNQSVQYEPVGTLCDADAGHQILQPINADGTRVFKQGQTVPAKFRVCDANQASIGTSGVVTSFFLTQIVSGTVTTIVQDMVDTNNPDTAFRWDSTDQQWIFNISTQNLAANSTYVYTIKLNDGTTISFQFGLR